MSLEPAAGPGGGAGGGARRVAAGAPGRIDVDGVWKRFRSDRRPRSLMRGGVGGLVRRRGHRWALRDIDLHVAPGEAVGLVGANGSGKSTLLKILTQVMDPYAGTVAVGGQVGALIEIQAGLHPELSGRDNIYLYGAFLGLPRRQVETRFDEIVAFAELDAAIDRQVKFFSSGMRMRLSFAVAATLQPDVLLVDEVLAVGDASFQQRCLDRLRRSITEGATLVFVSHDLAAVQSICHRAVWLDGGRVRADAACADVLGRYTHDVEERARQGEQVGPLQVRFTGASAGGGTGGLPATGEPLDLRLAVASDADRRGTLYLGLSEGTASPVLVVSREIDVPTGESALTVSLRDLPLGAGRYALWTAFHETKGDELVSWRPLADLDVIGATLDPPPPGVVRHAPVHVATTWTLT